MYTSTCTYTYISICIGQCPISAHPVPIHENVTINLEKDSANKQKKISRFARM